MRILNRGVDIDTASAGQANQCMEESRARGVRDFEEIVPAKVGYDRWSALYDSEDNPLIALDDRIVWPRLTEFGSAEILDLCCGTGRYAVRLAAAGARVTAVDFSSGMLGKASRVPGAELVSFLNADVTLRLGFDANRFDLALCCLALDHIQNLDHVFSELDRVVRPCGQVVVSVLHPSMMQRGVYARFCDMMMEREIRPEASLHCISDYVMAVLHAGLCIEEMSEHFVDDALVAVSPRAAKWHGWPLLLLMQLRTGASCSHNEAEDGNAK